MKRKTHFKKDLVIIIGSLTAAIILSQLSIINYIVNAGQGLGILGSFVVGIFFTSILTIVPATVVLAEMCKVYPPLLVALFGALGSVVGDLVIFLFIKENITEDIFYLVGKVKKKKFFALFHLRHFKWMTPLIGALLIISPLPDELGLAMMGLSGIRTSFIAPLSFVLNFIGILSVSWVVHAL